MHRQTESDRNHQTRINEACTDHVHVWSWMTVMLWQRADTNIQHQWKRISKPCLTSCILPPESSCDTFFHIFKIFDVLKDSWGCVYCIIITLHWIAVSGLDHSRNFLFKVGADWSFATHPPDSLCDCGSAGMPTITALKGSPHTFNIDPNYRPVSNGKQSQANTFATLKSKASG